MIAVENLTYQYTHGKPMRFPNFTVPQGKHVLLLGKSGSGKTTLLHLLGGLLKSQAGKISIQDTITTQLSEVEMDHYRGQHVGFVFQRNHLIRSLSVKNNLLLAPFLSGLQQNENRIDEVLTLLNMTEKKHARIEELSHGQAQRVAIARAVMNKPLILLADEPTSALDDESCEQVMNLLLKMVDENKTTLVIATHDQRLKSRLHTTIIL